MQTDKDMYYITMMRNDGGVVVYVNRSFSAVVREGLIGDVCGLALDFTVSGLCIIMTLYRTHSDESDVTVFLEGLQK